MARQNQRREKSVRSKARKVADLPVGRMAKNVKGGERAPALWLLTRRAQ